MNVILEHFRGLLLQVAGKARTYAHVSSQLVDCSPVGLYLIVGLPSQERKAIVAVLQRSLEGKLEVGHVFLDAVTQHRQPALRRIFHLLHCVHLALQHLHFPIQSLHLVLEVFGFLQIDGIVVEPSACFVREIGPVGSGHSQFLLERGAVGQVEVFAEADPDFAAILDAPSGLELLEDGLLGLHLLHAHRSGLGDLEAREVVLAGSVSGLRGCVLFGGGGVEVQREGRALLGCPDWKRLRLFEDFGK